MMSKNSKNTLGMDKIQRDIFRKEIYKALELPEIYSVDPELIKRNYYRISKDIHQKKEEKGMEKLNCSYAILKDDFKRASLFTAPASRLSKEFLMKCFDLEHKLGTSEKKDAAKYIQNQIQKCKQKYDDPVSLGKWTYYRRLLENKNDIDNNKSSL